MAAGVVLVILGVWLFGQAVAGDLAGRLIESGAKPLAGSTGAGGAFTGNPGTTNSAAGVTSEPHPPHVGNGGGGGGGGAW